MENEEKTQAFKGIYTEIERQEKINEEYARLTELLVELDDKHASTLKKLIGEAAFMAITLEECRKIIQRDGVIEGYQNGANQYGIKKSAAVEVYDRMVNTYSKVIEQINKALPENNLGAGDAIKKFINEGK